MNKILMDGDLISYDKSCDNIEVKGNATLYIKDTSDYKINIDIKDNGILHIYDFTKESGEKEITINQSNNTKVTFVHSFIIESVYKLKIISYINGNNNTNDVFISGVSKGNVTLDVDGIVSNNTVNNTLNENIKVLTINGKCFVAPKLHVNTLDVIANHNTAISNIREDILFYLMSKGIDELHAASLIEDSYVYGYLKEQNEEFYKYIISE